MLQLETQRLPFTRRVDKLALAAAVVIVVILVVIVVVVVVVCLKWACLAKWALYSLCLC